MRFEDLQIKYENDVKTKEVNLKHGLKGIYKNGKIIVDSKLTTDAEKVCILVEEIGHHFTSYGDTVDKNKLINVKQEYKAMSWAYEEIINIKTIVQAWEYGIRDKYELADFLGVTLEFLENAIHYHKRKHGVYCVYHNYIVCFIPTLQICKR